MDEDEEKFIKENPILFKKYKVKKKLGEGAFGNVYLGQAISNNAYVAIKTELRKIIKPILESEAFLLYSIAGPGIPEVKSFGKTKKYNILVEPLLGKSLFDIFAENHKSMSLSDACLIGKQVIDRIQWVHSKYIVHRDIKPDNFLIGRNDPNVLYLIDFGLSKKYRSTTTGKHIRFGFTGKLTGTVRFASCNALRGGEQSRRDDIESIGYMIIYFLKKRLPWQSITGNKKMERYLKIYKMKKNIAPEKLCEGLPHEMAEYINYAKNLEFEQEPDYKYLKKLFDNILKRINISNENLIFSWIKMADLTNLKNPINLNTRKDSPQSRIYKKIKNNLEKGKNLSSDSDSKIGSYNQVPSSYALTSSNIQIINNQNIFSEDQFESTKDKNILNKSMKSKEGLNTTVANLDVTVDENVLNFENEKEIKDLDENNKKINRNLNQEFNLNKVPEINDSNNDKKEENSDNKNMNLTNNISDNSNNILDNILDKNKKENEKPASTMQNKKLKDNDNTNNQINISKIITNKSIPKKLDANDFTFNETINSNNNIVNNNLVNEKEKKNQNNIINKNEIKREQLTGNDLKLNNNKNKDKKRTPNKQIQTINKTKKNENNNKINNKTANTNNKDKLIKKKSTKSEKKNHQNNTLTIKYKKLNIVKNEEQNKSANKPNEIKKDNNEYDLINQISKETNNNIYNILDDEINFKEDVVLQKRPSIGPAFNPLSINKNRIVQRVNDKHSLSEKKKNIIKNPKENNIIYKDNTKKSLHQIKTNFDFPYNNDDLNDFKDDGNCDTLKAISKKQIRNKTIYRGNNFKSFHNIEKNFSEKLNLIPEDNNYIKQQNIIKDNYFQNNNNTNNYPKINENIGNMSAKPNLNKIKYLNDIKIKKENPNVLKVNKNTKIVKLNNNENNTIRKVSTSTNISIKKVVLNYPKVKMIGVPKVKKIQNNPINQYRIINNNNYNSNITYRNNLSKSAFNPIINNQIMTNSQINYQFPVYINNNNNIYNTQYLNTVRNIPIVQNINNLNNTITIQPAPIQTNLNFGQNLGFHFVNTNPNNFNNIRYDIVPNSNCTYEFRKKYNVSLVKK